MTHVMTHVEECSGWSEKFLTGRRKEKEEENVQLKWSLSRLLISFPLTQSITVEQEIFAT